MRRHKKPMHMEDRKRMQQDVAWLPAPIVMQDDGIGREVAMA